MFFGKSNKKDKKNSSADDVHFIFKIGSLAVIVYIIYSVYISGGQKGNLSKDLSVSNVQPALTEEKIKKDVEAAFEKMYNSPKFKKIKEFVDYVESNSDKEQAKLLKAEDGYILFIPNKAVEQKVAGKLLEINGEDLNVKIDLEKLNGEVESEKK